ncbi:MAG: hypothetical protein C0595_15040 [Marinilabiliales bacterium]|nr:MAG: hypothetical protein C0595_15040 [Marinilabiliales bacterium]
MVNISANYLGISLKNPLIVGSSRLTGELNTLKQCVDKGASAVVLKSLFEEQIVKEAESKISKNNIEEHYFWFKEAEQKILDLSFDQNMQRYLDYVLEVKRNVEVPVISSINCVSSKGWPKFASEIEKAGADALELNIGIFPFDIKTTSAEIENTYFDIIREVKANVNIPVSVKIGSYFTNILSFANGLVEAGADGIVLFNRYFRPDIDMDTRKLVASDNLSSPDDYLVAMRWIGLLVANKINCDLVASTGVHNYEAVVKQILAGANAVQLCSTLYLNGIDTIEKINNNLISWMENKGYNSLEDFRSSSLDLQSVDASFERIQYIKRSFND